MKKNPKILILLIMSICLFLAFAACNGTDTDGKNDTTFVSGTLDGVKSIGNGNSAAPTDLVPDNSGKVTFNTPESKKPHDITVTSEFEHGTLSSNLNSAVGGKTVTLSYASPTVGGGGYKIRAGSLCVNGEAITDFHFVSSDGSKNYYTTSFTMSETAATITASEYLYYNVGIAEFIDNGGISLSMTEYEYGKTTAITVTITPDSGYRLKEGSLRWGDTVITKTNGEYTFTIPSDRYGQIIVHAEFEEIVPDYAVVVSSSIQNGTVQANVSRAEEGDIVTLTLIPNENYALKSGSLKYTPTGGTATAVTENAGVYSFVMPESDVTINAEFARLYYLDLPEYAEGRVTSERTEYVAGETVTLTVTPKLETHSLKRGSLKYTPEGGDTADVTDTNGVYTFEMPEADVTIDAVFALHYNLNIFVGVYTNDYRQFYFSENTCVFEGITVYTITGPTTFCEGEEVTFTFSIDPRYSRSLEGVRFRDEYFHYYPELISTGTNDENGNVSSVTISAMPAFDLRLEMYIEWKR